MRLEWAWELIGWTCGHELYNRSGVAVSWRRVIRSIKWLFELAHLPLTWLTLDAFFLEPCLYDKQASRVDIWTSIVMFVLSTIHVLASLVRAIEAFEKHSGDPLRVQDFVEDQVIFWDLLTAIIYGLQTLLGDCIMLYRVHVICKGGRKLFFGLLLCFLTNLGVGIAALIEEHQALEPPQTVLATLAGLALSFFLLTFLTNLILIASRICWIKRRVASASTLPSFTDKGRFSVVTILIHSGAIYAIFLLTLIILTIMKSRSIHIVFDTITVIIAITFTVINPYVGLANSDKNSGSLPLPSTRSWVSVSSSMVFAPPSPQQLINHIHGPEIQTLHAGNSTSIVETR